MFEKKYTTVLFLKITTYFQVKQAKFRERFNANAPFSYNTLNPYSSLEKVSTYSAPVG